MNPVTLNLAAAGINLAMYIYGRNPINFGCVVISGSFAAAFYFFPAGVV